MSLEQKIEDLTAAVEALTKRLSANIVNVVNTGAKKADESGDDESNGDDDGGKPDKPKRRTKAQIAADKAAKSDTKGDDDDLGDEDDLGDDEDDLGDDDGDSKVTADDIRNLLHKVKDAKGAGTARNILAELGVKTIAQISEKQYDKVITLAKKAGVKL